MKEKVINETFKHQPFQKPIGVIYAHGFKNGCCQDKPFILMTTYGNVYSCECACNCWCTSGHDNPADAIMEYEMMCRGKLEKFNDEMLYEKYRKERRRGI